MMDDKGFEQLMSKEENDYKKGFKDACEEALRVFDHFWNNSHRSVTREEDKELKRIYRIKLKGTYFWDEM